MKSKKTNPDYIRIVFDRLLEAGQPNEQERQTIYQGCRDEIMAQIAEPGEMKKQLAQLEKVIVRQELQAIYEEGLKDTLEKMKKL